MRLTILYDNESARKDLVPDWGFSALVETDGGDRILFDTGGRGNILMGNMTRLGVEPDSIAHVFISHAHFDHTGGLSAFLERNSDVIVYAPPSFRGVRGVRELRYLDEPETLMPGVFSTGELAGIEQALVVETSKGLVVVVGCSHPNMAEILGAASRFGSLYGIVGGFHGFSEVELFNGLGLICPAHCTQHKAEILERHGPRCITAGAGTVIEL